MIITIITIIVIIIIIIIIIIKDSKDEPQSCDSAPRRRHRPHPSWGRPGGFAEELTRLTETRLAQNRLNFLKQAQLTLQYLKLHITIRCSKLAGKSHTYICAVFIQQAALKQELHPKSEWSFPCPFVPSSSGSLAVRGHFGGTTCLMLLV